MTATMSLDRLIKRAEARRQLSASSAPSSMNELQERSKKRVHPDHQELARILDLEFWPMLDEGQCEDMSRTHVLAHAFDDDFRLLPTQASALTGYYMANGGFFPIGVGWGKTGICLMTAEAAWKKGLQRSILLVPPNALEQLIKQDIPYWRRRVALSVPFQIIGGRDLAARRTLYRSGYKGCYIVPYSYLSVSDTIEMLEAIDPDLVIADECHKLKDRTRARFKRFKNMMVERDREFVAMSGTITSKSIEDYRHLIDMALKDKSPLPRSPNMALSWSRVLDAGAQITGDHLTGPLESLVDWANKHRGKTNPLRLTVSDLREAFRLRLHSAPGVTATGDNEVGASISIENIDDEGRHEETEGWEKLSVLMNQVQKEYITPNGDEIDCPLNIFKWMIELSTGFYNELIWPTPEQLVKTASSQRATHGLSRPMNLESAERALEVAKAAHALGQFYNKLLRGYFIDSPAGMDTPMEVARLINQKSHLIPNDLVTAYKVWHQAFDAIKARFGFVPERYSRAVRVCPFKINAAVEWAQEHQNGGILWVYHREMGKWLTEELEKAGLDPVYCPAGANEEISSIFSPEGTGKGDRLVVASIMAHGEAKNLQRAPAQLFIQWPRDAKQAEQTLGRVLRVGIEKFTDHVTINTLNLLPYDHVLFAACLNDAVYQHQTDSRRKMVYADYDPLPRIFSPEFLRTRGANPRMLNNRQREMLNDKFGTDWETHI